MRHVLATVIYTSTWAALLLTDVERHGDAVVVPLAIGASVVAGLVSGSWWAALLAAVLVPLAAAQPCGPEDRCELDPVVWSMFFLAPLSALLIAAGVGARRLVERR